MQHTIALETIGPQGTEMAHAVEKCVHCGFCLSVCPTYKVLGEEMDSPRGRIYLMKEQLEGNLPLDEMTPFVDRCLGCMACVTACPSGVEYGELLTPFRARAEQERSRNPLDQLTRLMVRETLPYPGRFRMAATLGKVAKPLKALLPAPLGNMLDLLPDALPTHHSLPEIVPAVGERRARVALLTGCVQQALAPQINRATLKVLAQNGVEVLIRGAGLLWFAGHAWEEAQALRLARHNLDQFMTLLLRQMWMP
ncbi:MAG: 4Fe-4S dicluster domain-containing protein [Caldilineaceae bacterium]